jgi:uncharacterized membrane protein YozB (DUF420 family)
MPEWKVTPPKSETIIDPLTKQDLQEAINDLKQFISERKNTWVKWMIGMQISYSIAIGVVIYLILRK